MRRAIAWMLPIVTTAVTAVFFYLMAEGSASLSRPIGRGPLATAVVIALLAIALNVLVVAIHGALAARKPR